YRSGKHNRHAYHAYLELEAQAMTFTPGAKLGPYEILSAIGAGGQGEVYKARDTRLNRTVAIKVLSAHFSDKAQMKARFEREVQTIAGLNHPHICVLYDVGHQDGTDYLVMEYLEGQTARHLCPFSSCNRHLLFCGHFLRFRNLDTMRHARSGCAFSPSDCHYCSPRRSPRRTLGCCRIRSPQTATPDPESSPETFTKSPCL